MKRFLLTTSFLASVLFGQAQYLDSAMVWMEYEELWYPHHTLSSDYVISIEGDTVFDGHTYFKLKYEGVSRYSGGTIGGPATLDYFCSIKPLGYLREDGSLFYYRPDNASPEEILYDFDLQVGDSVGTFPVIAIDTVLFAGEPRRRFWTDLPSVDQFYVLEGVGHTWGGLLWPENSEYHHWWTLVCASNSSMSEPYTLDSTYQCNRLSNYPLDFPCAASLDSTHISAVDGSQFVFNGDTTETLFFQSPGSYSVLLLNSFQSGCVGITFDVSFPLSPQVHELNVSGDSLVCPGDSVWLCGESDHLSYLWSTGITTECSLVTSEVCNNGSYSLYSYDFQGCLHEYYPFNIYCGDSVVANFSWQETIQGIEFDNSSINGTEYYWDFGNGDISNLENPVHQFANGTFDVCLIAANECMVDTICETVLLTGVDGTERKTPLSVQFNSGLLNVSSLDRIDRIQMLDASGRLVLSEAVGSGNCTLNVSEFENAVYILNVWFESGGVGTRKFTIQN